MSIDLILPAMMIAGLASAAGFARWPLRPNLAVWVLSAIAVAASSTVFVVALVGILGMASRISAVSALVDLCPTVPLHHSVGVVEGLLSIVIVLRTLVVGRRLLQKRRAATAGTAGRRIALLETKEPIAYAAPGKPGCVVVSQGMLDTLEVRERRVLFAHERAHLTLNHHRFLFAAELAVIVIPTLRPLSLQLRHATERAADDAALHAVDGDRVLVAQSIARAALSATAYAGVVGSFGGGSVPARVSALLGPPLSTRTRRLRSGLFGLVAMGVFASGSVQFHHLAGLIEHVCHL